MERTITASTLTLGINDDLTPEMIEVLENHGCNTDYEINEFTFGEHSCFIGRFTYTYIGHLADNYPKFFNKIETDTEKFFEHLELMDKIAYKFYLLLYASYLEKTTPPEDTPKNPLAYKEYLVNTGFAAELALEKHILKRKYE